MGGGLMHLVAYGAQDIYLTGNPQITFFKVVYRRHTNFSMESIKQTFSGTADYGREATVSISRNGDLIHKIWLEHKPDITKPVLANKWMGGTAASPDIHGYVPNYGHALIEEVELEIGGQTIDRQTGQWMQAWSDLTEFNPEGHGHAGRVNLAETSGSNTTLSLKADTASQRSGIAGISPGVQGVSPYESYHDTRTKTLFQKMTGTAGESCIFENRDGSSISLERDITENALNIGINGGAKVLDYTPDGTGTFSAKTERIFIPLQFWFCRNVGLALPLIALQYHEVKIKLSLTDADKLYGYTGCYKVAEDSIGETTFTCTSADISAKANKGTNASFDLWVDYIYLDTDERRRFAQVSHEYLIEQVQFIDESISTNGSAQSPNIDLNFNHPVKELVWFARNTQGYLFGNLPAIEDSGASYQGDGIEQVYPLVINATGDALASGDSSEAAQHQAQHDDDAITAQKSHFIIHDSNSVQRQHGSATFLSDISNADDGTWQLKLNGHDRFAERSTKYFTRTQVKDYHNGLGGVYNRDSISVYSFALKPEEHQPSGTCNFSRIDNAELIGKNIKYPRGANELSIYAVNYNVLRIMSGMGGLAYSN